MVRAAAGAARHAAAGGGRIWCQTMAGVCVCLYVYNMRVKLFCCQFRRFVFFAYLNPLFYFILFPIEAGN